MPELEIIKLARHIQSIWSLLALALLLLYLVAGKVLQVRAQGQERNVSRAFRTAVLSKVFWFGTIVIVAALIILALPVLAFRETPVHGVVLRKGAQTTVAGAQISLDGFSELSTTTDNNGNFQLRVPADRRQDDYTVRAQLGGAANSAKVTDAAAPTTSLSIELSPSEDSSSATVNVPDGWSLRTVLQSLADGDKSTIIFGKGCIAAFLNSKVRGGQLRAGTVASVMEELPRRLIRPPVSLRLTAIRDSERGHYEVECIN